MKITEIKQFEPQLKFGWFYLKCYSIFQDLRQRSIETGFMGDLSRGLDSLNSDTVNNKNSRIGSRLLTSTNDFK